MLKIYQSSLSLAYFLLFGLSFWLHALGGLNEHNTEQLLKGKARQLTLWEIMGSSDF